MNARQKLVQRLESLESRLGVTEPLVINIISHIHETPQISHVLTIRGETSNLQPHRGPHDSQENQATNV